MADRWTQEQARAFALELPEAHEAAHHGTPDLRVRGKIFASLPPGEDTLVIKTEPLALDTLVQLDPLTYRNTWGGRWVRVDLGRIDPAELRELILDGYCLAAPKMLAARVRGPDGAGVREGRPRRRNAPADDT